VPRVRGLIGPGREQPGSVPPDPVMTQVTCAFGEASARRRWRRGVTAPV
jgi:hypothetical protein